jgi:hypothetical protein
MGCRRVKSGDHRRVIYEHSKSSYYYTDNSAEQRYGADPLNAVSMRQDATLRSYRCLSAHHGVDQSLAVSKGLMNVGKVGDCAVHKPKRSESDLRCMATVWVAPQLSHLWWRLITVVECLKVYVSIMQGLQNLSLPFQMCTTLPFLIVRE